MGKTGRPLGITIIAILEILAALFLIFVGILLAFAVTLIAGLGSIVALPFLGVSLGVILVIPGFIILLVGIGLFKGWKWTWYLEVILLGLGAILDIVSIVTAFTDVQSIATNIVSLLIEVVFLWYFFRQNVKAFFGV